MTRIAGREPQGSRRYCHLGTGNYNERTARVYTDFGLMTSSQTIAEDATKFFSTLTGYSDPPQLKNTKRRNQMNGNGPLLFVGSL